MIGSLPALVEALRRALRDEVAPDLASDHARTQLAAVVDILGKLEAMAVWSPDAQRRRLQAVLAGCEAFMARLHQDRVASRPVPWAPAGDADAAVVLADAERHLVDLVDWLFERWDTLPGETAAALDAIVRDTLRQGLLIERKLIPLTDFAAMSAPATRD